MKELNELFGHIPPEVVGHVRKHYGPCADRILQEKKNIRFCNPILISCGETTICRIEEFWKRPWSATEPEPGSLTEYYRKIRKSEGDDDNALVGEIGGSTCGDSGDGIGVAGVWPGE